MRVLSFLFFLIIIILGATFAYLNAHSVVFNYYFSEKTLPLSLLLVLAVGVGLLLGLVIVIVPWLRLKHHNRKLKKRLKYAEQELDNLRNIPLNKENVC